MFLKRPGAEIFYDTWGEGDKWVTLVNGHTRTHKDFRLFGKSLVAAGFHVLVLDNRGAGASETSMPYQGSDMAGDVVALWDHLGIDASHLLGISMGGQISQLIATQFPERLCCLFLISTTPDCRWLVRSGVSAWGDDLPTIQKQLEPYFSSRFLANSSLLIKAMAKNILAEVKDGFNNRALAQRTAFAGFNITSELGHIGARTLVIHGRDDQVIAVQAAEELYESIPDAQLEIIPECGHLLLAEAPKVLGDLVLNFLATNT